MHTKGTMMSLPTGSVVDRDALAASAELFGIPSAVISRTQPNPYAAYLEEFITGLMKNCIPHSSHPPVLTIKRRASSRWWISDLEEPGKQQRRAERRHGATQETEGLSRRKRGDSSGLRMLLDLSRSIFSAQVPHGLLASR